MSFKGVICKIPLICNICFYAEFITKFPNCHQSPPYIKSYTIRFKYEGYVHVGMVFVVYFSFFIVMYYYHFLSFIFLV